MSVKPKLIWHQFFPQPDQLWLNGQINFGVTEVDRKDLSETNSKLKGPIWNLRNLKDLSKINSKLKGPIWNVRNLKDLSETNMKLKGLGEVFGLKTNTHLYNRSNRNKNTFAKHV